MSVIDKIKDYMLGVEEEYDDEYDYDDDEYDYEDDYEEEDTKQEPLSAYGSRSSRTSNPIPTTNDNSKVVSLNTTNGNVPGKMQVVISYPQSVDEAGSICDYIKVNKTVVVNLENTKYEVAQRIVDFLGGVAYALDGDIQCISNRIFIIAPRNVEISGNLKDELKANGLLYSFTQSFGAKA